MTVIETKSNRSDFIIRPLQPSDLVHLGDLQPPDWGPIGPIFRSFLSRPHCSALALDDLSGRLLGVANGSRFGSAGWVGPIIVAPAARGRGFGTALTQAVLDELTAAGCVSIALLATELGAPIYRRLGFMEAGSYSFMARSQIAAEEASVPDPAKATPAGCTVRLEPLQPSDSGTVLALDRIANGFDRSLVYEGVQLAGWAARDMHTGKLRGYYAQHAGEGPVIAVDEEAGIALLKMKLANGNVDRAVLPAGNEPGVQFLLTEGWEIKRTALRMTLGPPLKWRPQFIYHRISGFWG
ncbi:GNAT family N-acetyltransferase [Paenibacillus chartarius]|uniref:GNAT family N-acetyltransferase n=1 Tax=Paenibacillus chartarius TaxID=747481 RepID=A0ABV6DKV9_9BACL